MKKVGVIYNPAASDNVVEEADAFAHAAGFELVRRKAATVKDVRARTAGRTRPWTHDELTRMAGGGRGGQRP